MICCICNQDLPIEAFYPSEFRGNRKPRCKECRKARKRKLNKLNEGIVMKGRRLVIRENRITRIYWSPNMLSELKRYFPNSPNKEVAELLGVSESTMIRKARELGLVKEKRYIRENSSTKSLSGVLARQRKEKSNGKCLQC